MKCPNAQPSAYRSRRNGTRIGTRFIVTLTGLLLAASAPAMDAARWTIGHAAVQADPGMRGQLLVKLSLRNEGRPERVGVRLFGRWAPAGQAPRKVTPRELAGFALLGRYQREVAMKQTAVVTGSLAVLRHPPPLNVLELVAVTGAVITDQRRVAVAPP